MWSKLVVPWKAALFQYNLRSQLEQTLQSKEEIDEEINGILVNIWVATTDRSEIALEVTNIDRVEAYDCDEEADVGL